MFKRSVLISGFAALVATSISASAAGLSSTGMQFNDVQMVGNQVIPVTSRLSAAKGKKKRVARTMRGNLSISPSSAAGDGYPTPGRAFEACGGAGNVFVMYDIQPDGSHTNHSYHCT